MYLGGLTLSLHNMMPFKGGYLFLDSAPDTPRNDTVQIRCYSNADRVSSFFVPLSLRKQIFRK